MNVLALVLYIIAAVLFGVAAFGVAAARFNLVAGGLFFLATAELVAHGALGAGNS